ncbi:hypothetical protein CYLTODRAFT_419585 [Cylindrobasidium torrendii FP15055 ss-10]|uniref:BZIP domain-containing protein n=1 Tax=Cylindrobasidium torrendii FP15055 ss-10 TaxID=1314674 RepID=A0A0D7BKI0_9AGAR|nr:hypothetical protein CYLTODRAFT_419585 [Cylindrobasidium torrendii FP15055 ss-10]
MAPPNLQGLNVVLPPESPDASHDLLSAYTTDLSGLSGWMNFPVDPADEAGPSGRASFGGSSYKDDAEEGRYKNNEQAKNAAIQDGHVNVTTGTAQGLGGPQLDINMLLSGLGGDFGQQMSGASLVQLLQFNAHNQLMSPPPVPQPQPEEREEEREPPAKRARTRKASVSVSEVSSPSDDKALSPQEDKRRRNTAASARFRMKKKEREAALEGKSKELEARVSELERECESLRRENGWLKGLVVGVTGAANGNTLNVPGATSAKRPREDDA